MLSSLITAVTYLRISINTFLLQICVLLIFLRNKKLRPKDYLRSINYINGIFFFYLIILRSKKTFREHIKILFFFGKKNRRKLMKKFVNIFFKRLIKYNEIILGFLNTSSNKYLFLN